MIVINKDKTYKNNSYYTYSMANMEDHYKIVIKDKVLSTEEIEKYKDFDALLEKHQNIQALPKSAVRIFNMKKLISSAAAVFLGGMVCVAAWYYSQPTTNYLSLNNEYFESTTVQVKAEGLDFKTPHTEQFTLVKGENSVSVNGYNIIIPAQAFSNISSNEGVRFEITIYDTVNELIAGGFHTKLNQNQLLTENTVIQLNAFSQEIALENNKSFTIQTENNNKGLYALNNGKWNFSNEAVSQTITTEAAKPKVDIDATLAAFQAELVIPVEPKTPIAYNENNTVFELPYNEEVYDQKVSLWEVIDNSNASLFDIEWDDFKINENGGFYKVVLTLGERTETVNIRPVLDDVAFQQANAKYQQELEAYKAALASNEAAVNAKKLELQSNENLATTNHKTIHNYSADLGLMNFAKQQSITNYDDYSFQEDVEEEDAYALIVFESSRAIVRQPLRKTIKLPNLASNEIQQVYSFQNGNLIEEG